MHIHGLQDTAHNQQELDVIMWGFARIQKIDSIVCSQRPVVMFTGSVYSCKRFFMKQALHSVLTCHTFQCLHYQLIIVNSDVCLCVNGSQLMLRRRNLIVLRLCGHSHFPQFDINVLHKRGNSLTDGSEIMIIHLLSLRRHRAKQGTPCVDQVLSLLEFFSIHQEIFLLRSYGRSNFFGICISKQPQQT